MNIRIVVFAALAALVGVSAFGAVHVGEMQVTANRMAADRKTGEALATGDVYAVAAPFRLKADWLSKSAEGDYLFPDPTQVTTCSNDWCALHWRAQGEVAYRNGKAIIAKNMKLYALNVPVMWLPYWYYPMDTNYGLRVMPGYISRWGCYLLNRYVYNIAGVLEEGHFGLAGSTRLDWRQKNGMAVGQDLNWQLGDFGAGGFRVYYAWDDDYDYYDRHWNGGNHSNYRNWYSEVPHDRYGMRLHHRWEASERDSVRVDASYFSDSMFQRDFIRNVLMAKRQDIYGGNDNELAWEHIENSLAGGVSVSGPLNDFYQGVARLPEIFLDVLPQPLFSSPFNYESQNRVAYLRRQYAEYGDERTSEVFRFNPGPWADYRCLRVDTYHRVTLPMKFADILSVVPRAAYRGTFWSEAGDSASSDGARKSGDHPWRSIYEGGVTFAMRGTAELRPGLRHILEPYFDVLAQEADWTGLSRGSRPYIFDALDTSRDFLDQFAGRSRNLPGSWYGVTPGVRNVFARADERGNYRTFLDVDVYAAVQLNRTDWRDRGAAAPGARLRWSPADGSMVSARTEYDSENNRLAYASLAWTQRVDRDLSFKVAYVNRDQRWCDYLPAGYDPAEMTEDGFNWVKFSLLTAEVEHEICDAVAWGPFISWDCRDNELDEIGAWLDLRTDCLGFRFQVGYDNSYTRIDRTECDDDWNFGFYIYLRAFGPGSGNPLAGSR